MKVTGTVCIILMSLLSGLSAGEVSSTRSKDTFSRPEERGQQYTDSSVQEIVQLLKTSTDKIEQRKLANELGNRSIKGGLDLSPDQAKTVREYAEKQLNLADNPDSNIRSESRCQIARTGYAVDSTCHNILWWDDHGSRVWGRDDRQLRQPVEQQAAAP